MEAFSGDGAWLAVPYLGFPWRLRGDREIVEAALTNTAEDGGVVLSVQLLSGRSCKQIFHHSSPLDEVLYECKELSSGGPKGGHLKGGHLKMGFSLRAQGTLISEPQSSIPCDMRFSPSYTGKMATLRGSASKWPFSLYRLGRIAYRKG